MKISIITVCWNSVDKIRDAMASVAAQRAEAKNLGVERLEIEYLVIDGGSTDGTVEIIKEFEHDHCSPSPSTFTFRWLSEKDNGMYDALNKGIRMATGEVIGILNADDVLDGPEVLARVAAAFEKVKVKGEGEQRIDCLFGNVRFVAPSPSPKTLTWADLVSARTSRVCFARFWHPWMLQWGYMPPHPAIFIRRRCFEQWGGYVGDKKKYRIAADYELLIRFFRVHRMTHRYMRLCTTVMRPGGMSTANVEARRCLNAEIIKGNKENGYFCCWPMLLPKYFIKIWEFILPRLGFGQGDKVLRSDKV